MTNTFAASIKSDTLSLKAAGLIQISSLYGPYGDGSGELENLIGYLSGLSEVDTSSIVTLLALAATHFRIKASLNSLSLIQSFLSASTSNANSLSSALRDTFSGWNRWIISFSVPTVAALAWLPFCDPKPTVPPTYSLLWLKRDVNEWAVIVEGDAQKGYKKVGIAFVNSAPMGQETDVTLI